MAAGRQLVPGLCWCCLSRTWRYCWQGHKKLLEVTNDNGRNWQKLGGQKLEEPGGMAGFYRGLRRRCVRKGQTWRLKVEQGNFVPRKANNDWGSTSVKSEEEEVIGGGHRQRAGFSQNVQVGVNQKFVHSFSFSTLHQVFSTELRIVYKKVFLIRIQAIYANQAAYLVFQHLVTCDLILNSLKILVPNHLITQSSAVIKLTRTRTAALPYISSLIVSLHESF